MQGETQARTLTGAVFLSYASQDAEAAKRICDALRAAGVEVWFDQSELRGGDAWDRQIRKQIHDCALFVPIISAHSDARHEGYFRREWRLAVERAGDIAEDVPFLLPVVIDSTPDTTARVPDRFREVQWSRLPEAQATPAFVQRVIHLLAPTSHGSTTARCGPVGVVRAPAQVAWSPKRTSLGALAVLVLAAVAYLAIHRLRFSSAEAMHATPPAAAVSVTPPAAFSPPPHSVAVLPFVNISGDKEQEYFSDGLSEELLNDLARIKGLQVAARTSAFSFKGKNTDIGTIGRKLNVAAVLEGSVRRSAHTVRIAAQLINAATGFHMWSQTYDRDLGDVLQLQTDIAESVADALKVTLLGDAAAKIEIGGTRNPAAFDAYLRARKTQLEAHHPEDYLVAIAGLTKATELDPNYALAFANRSLAMTNYIELTWPPVGDRLEKARTDALKAIALAPELAEGHLALASYFQDSLDLSPANREFEKALALAPGNARVLRDYSTFAVAIGRTEAGIAAARRAVLLDPLDRDSHQELGVSLYLGTQYREALDAFQNTLAIDPEYPGVNGVRGLAYYALGELQSALASCEIKSEGPSQQCLAITYRSLNRHADAERTLAKLKAARGDAAAYQYGEIYAQWGDVPQALEWLEKAMQLRDGGLLWLKADPLLDPLRNEPRFQAIERELKFPN